MVFSLTWFPDVFESANLKYSECPGWRNRGRAEMGRVRGVMIHHTAGARTYNMPSLDLLTRGRADLSGPLAQLGLGRDGTFYIIAAGRANHAGEGIWQGIRTGNSSFIGIEVENAGTPDDPYPPVQMEALRRGVAAMLKKIGADASMVCGHKEFAPGRKIDPLWDMPAFREGVAALLASAVPPAQPIPAFDPKARPTLRRGDRGPFVTRLQTLLVITPATANFGPITEARLRAFQRGHDLVPDGISGPKTWDLLDGGAPVRRPASPVDPASGSSPRPSQDSVGPAVDMALAAVPVGEDAQHPVHADLRAAYGPDGRRFASRAKLGFVTYGQTGADEFLTAHPEAGEGLSPSTLRTIVAVMGNEGKLEAVNSYDSCFLSFGILQWTAGQKSEPGELAALLGRLKGMNGTTFETYFGCHGLDARAAAGAVTGTLSLDGKTLLSPAQKAVLRSPAWAYRFWRAGHDPVVRHCQIVHAAGRIARFADAVIAGHPVRVWLSSELGMALLFDQHVNRPSQVPKTLEKALGALMSESAVPGDITQWTEADEDRLIHRYIALRAATSMTNSSKRAAHIDALAHAGKLSTARGSFR